MGSEVFVSLVDANEAPYRHDLRQLGLTTLCTNRDLPLTMPVGKGNDRLHAGSQPAGRVDALPGRADQAASRRRSFGPGDNRLAADQPSVTELPVLADQRRPAGRRAALRELLSLYGDAGEPAPAQADRRRPLGRVVSRSSRPCSPTGRMTFARGVQVTVTCDEAAFEGTGVFLLGAVLERFFAKYVSINSFTETVIRTVGPGRDHAMAGSGSDGDTCL